MFICDYNNGEWHNPRIEPLALIPTHPAAMALHYGQAIFEGMKATLGKDGTPLLFRPLENAKRMNFSADRMECLCFLKIYLWKH
jgi:branched-chain amino acid aminotransferase